MSKEAIWKWRPLMWLMPLLIGLTMFIVVMPAQASAAEQTWITWGTPSATWTGSGENEADLYMADQPVALTGDTAVITYTVAGGVNKSPAQLLDAEGEAVAGATCSDPPGTESRTVTMSGLSKGTTYKLYWDSTDNQNRLDHDVYLTFTTENPSQTWITWGTPDAAWVGSDDSGADYYMAKDVVPFAEDNSVDISYSVQGGQKYGHVKLQNAEGGPVEGASVNELDGTDRTATITGLAPDTQYRLRWAASESNGKLEHDVYMTFTTEEGEAIVTEPEQDWITFGSPEVEWKQFKDDADWYQAKNKVPFDSSDNIVITYSVQGGQKYGHVKLQNAEGGPVEEASVNEPNGTERTATITGLAQNTSYRLFWSADESNGKLSHDVYLTFTTAGPSQNWITWGTPSAAWTGNDVNGADFYEASEAVEFEDDDSIIIKYSVSGGRKYGHVQLQSIDGNEVEGASVDEPDDANRTVTITGLKPETSYRLYWDKEKAIGERPHLACDVYLTFTTGSIDPEALRVIGVKEKYEYTGSEITLEFTVKVGDATLTEGTDYEVTYEGERVNAGGSVTMTVTGKEGTPYEGKSKEKQFNIAKAQITSECVALPKGAGVAADGTVQYTYTGSEIKPAPVVTVNGRELERGTDYVLSYTEDADFINVESGKVLTVNVVHANGSNYDGAGTVKYTIVPKSITPSVALSKTSYTYSGKTITPAATVKAGTKALKKGTDYTVSYTTTHKTVGKHGVKVTLKGNYKGTRTATFKILPKKAAVSKAAAGKKKVTVKLKTKVSATGGSTYQIAYRVKGTSKWKYTTTTKQSKTIKKLKKGKKYQIRARAYKTVSKVKYYGAWSKTVTTKKVK